MKRRRRLASVAPLVPFIAAALAATSAAPGCYGATEIDVTITTTVPCTSPSSLTTQIFTGATGTKDFGTAPAAETEACGAAEPRVGTLSIVPTVARDDQFDLEVVGAVGVPTTDCRDASLGSDSGTAAASTATKGCIVARRRVSFRPHKTQGFTVLLDARCIGVPCGTDQTCDQGVCTSTADCTDLGCPRELGTVAVDAGPDAVADASSADAQLDAGDAGDAGDAAPLLCPTTPEVVVDTQNIVGRLTLDGDDLVYVNQTTSTTTREVQRVPRSGVKTGAGLRTVRTVSGLTAATAGPLGTAWAGFAPGVLTVTLNAAGGSDVTAISSALAGPNGLAFAGSSIVGITAIGGGAVTGFKVFAAQGMSITFGKDAIPGAGSKIVSDARGDFYGVVGTGTLIHYRVDATGPVGVWTTSAGSVREDIALANGMIYFVVTSTNQGIHRVPVDGAPSPTPTYTGMPWSAGVPSSLAADDTTLYALEGTSISTTPITAGSAVKFTTLTNTNGPANRLEVDDRCVYWVESNTRIMRRAKR
jgi:hypothetical protein